MTVNQRVLGSSPRGGALQPWHLLSGFFLLYETWARSLSRTSDNEEGVQEEEHFDQAVT